MNLITNFHNLISNQYKYIFMLVCIQQQQKLPPPSLSLNFFELAIDPQHISIYSLYIGQPHYYFMLFYFNLSEIILSITSSICKSFLITLLKM